MNALVLHNARLILREPGPAISRILSPLALMVLIRPLIRASDPGPGGTVRAVLLPLVLFSMLGLSIVANALLGERIWHTLDRLRATPLRATSLVLGKCAIPLAIWPSARSRSCWMACAWVACSSRCAASSSV